ncbi:MAG: Rab family GTPase [Candidatus Thorarchaeota archaeon]
MRNVTAGGKVHKTVLIGEGGVGKTSITLRYTENRFEEDMKITIGANFASKQVIVEGDCHTLMLWDLGGQPRFREVVSGYFRGAKIAIAVYDATRPVSLDRLDDWIGRLREEAPDCELVFVGNKTDARNNGNGVQLQEGIEYAQKYNAPCFELSAKSGEGVNELFEIIGSIMAQKNGGGQ